MCEGFWETCKCEDCKRVACLYEQLEWFEKDKEFNIEIIEELTKKIEDLGYSV